MTLSDTLDNDPTTFDFEPCTDGSVNAEPFMSESVRIPLQSIEQFASFSGAAGSARRRAASFSQRVVYGERDLLEHGSAPGVEVQLVQE
jgi:hypothetical protein